MNLLKNRITYCTNIHSGEEWESHFLGLKQRFPLIKKSVSPNASMNIGLRVSNQASLALMNPQIRAEFKTWLNEQDAYVALINGFPYGAFHDQEVKAQVHAPDWTTRERVDYTLRLISILEDLLPSDIDGGISTAPLTYRHWHETPEVWQSARAQTTANVVEVATALYQTYQNTGKKIHLDIEPEACGMLESGDEFLAWYLQDLLPMAVPHFQHVFSLTEQQAEKAVKQVVQLCYDVCHFALGFEHHAEQLANMKEHGIGIGRFQISAALKAELAGDLSRLQVLNAFGLFDEPNYLHQVVARTESGRVIRYRDLSDALDHVEDEPQEWRSHFHVPIFMDDFDVLSSTQSDIIEVLKLNADQHFTSHLEVETYTWQVLPSDYQVPIEESISRELNWVSQQLAQLTGE